MLSHCGRGADETGLIRGDWCRKGRCACRQEKRRTVLHRRGVCREQRTEGKAEIPALKKQRSPVHLWKLQPHLCSPHREFQPFHFFFCFFGGCKMVSGVIVPSQSWGSSAGFSFSYNLQPTSPDCSKFFMFTTWRSLKENLLAKFFTFSLCCSENHCFCDGNWYSAGGLITRTLNNVWCDNDACSSLHTVTQTDFQCIPDPINLWFISMNV